MTTDTERERLWVKGELSLWGLFANVAGKGASGHWLWHFFAARRMIVQWEKGETVHMLQHYMHLGLAEIK